MSLPFKNMASSERAKQAHLSKNMVRLQNPQNGKFLHSSASKETDNVEWSWLGYKNQAKTLRERAKIRGDDWTYKAVHRAELEGGDNV
jgi:hypothetical protein